MEIKVVNKYHLGRPQAPEEGIKRVVIHRGTALGNPFKMENSSLEERNRVCDAYESWLPKKLLEQGAELQQFKELAQLAQQCDRLELICFCAPKRCHGDTIKQLLEEHLSRV